MIFFVTYSKFFCSFFFNSAFSYIIISILLYFLSQIVSSERLRLILNSNEIHKILSEVSVGSELNIYESNTGASEEGIDLGSRNFKTIKKPRIGLLVGEGVRSYDAGEIWYIMDRQYNIPITKMTN